MLKLKWPFFSFLLLCKTWRLWFLILSQKQSSRFGGCTKTKVKQSYKKLLKQHGRKSFHRLKLFNEQLFRNNQCYNTKYDVEYSANELCWISNCCHKNFNYSKSMHAILIQINAVYYSNPHNHNLQFVHVCYIFWQDYSKCLHSFLIC